MPFILPVLASIGSFIAGNAPAIAAAASAASAGVGIGETLANPPGGGGGGAPPPAEAVAPTAPTPSSPSAAFIASQAPNVQAQTGGFLAPASFSDMLARLTSNPGQGPGVENVLFGAGGTGLTDMVATLSNPQQSLTQPTGG